MTIDPTEAARIAKGLTKAQREALLVLRPDRWRPAGMGLFNANAANRLVDKKLADRAEHFGAMDYTLTPLGAAVAEALKTEGGA